MVAVQGMILYEFGTSGLDMDDSQLGAPLVYTGSSNPLPPHSPEQATSQTKGPGDTPCSSRLPLKDAEGSGGARKRQLDRGSGSEDDMEANSSGGGESGGGGGHYAKKQRLVWTPELHSRFLTAVNHLGIKNAVPKTILALMNVEGMTRENVASHLQKYRLYLKKLAGYGPNDKVPADVLQQAQEQASQQVLCGMLTQGAAYGGAFDADSMPLGPSSFDAMLGNFGGALAGPAVPGPMGPWIIPPIPHAAPGGLPTAASTAALGIPAPFATQPAYAGQPNVPGVPPAQGDVDYNDLFQVGEDLFGTGEEAPITTRDLQYPPYLPVSLVTNPLSFAGYGPMARPLLHAMPPQLLPPSIPSAFASPPFSQPQRPHPQPQTLPCHSGMAAALPSTAPSWPSSVTAMQPSAGGQSIGVSSLPWRPDQALAEGRAGTLPDPSGAYSLPSAFGPSRQEASPFRSCYVPPGPGLHLVQPVGGVVEAVGGLRQGYMQSMLPSSAQFPPSNDAVHSPQDTGL